MTKNKGMVGFDAEKNNRINKRVNDLLKEITMVVQETAKEEETFEPYWMIMNSQVITLTIIQHIAKKTNAFNEDFIKLIQNSSEEDLKNIAQEMDEDQD